MENHTSLAVFHIVSFYSTSAYKSYFFTMFLLLYLIGWLANAIIIIVIYIDEHLHTPMYLFLSNLSIIDVCYTTVTIPKLLYMLLSGNYTMSFIQCFTQMYFVYGFGSTEIILLSTMAYDRYVAICNPLHYHRIFSWKFCMQLTVPIWLSGCFNSLLITLSASNMCFSYSHKINQYFCDMKSLMAIACTSKEVLFIVAYVELFLFGFCPFFSSLISYLKIISTILKMKTRDGRKKAFSTCSSHLTVITIFYGTAASVFMIPPNGHYQFLVLIFTILYTAVTPMLNPLIYSLQNKDVKRAIERLIQIKSF